MQIRQGNALQALRGVQQFLDAHADRLGDLAKTGARKKLDAQVEDVSLHVLTQSGSNLESQGATQKQYTLRHALLYGHMAPIARIAAAELPETPELIPLKMPKGTVSTEGLYAAAIGMANAAEPHTAVFIEGGLAPDFLAQFRSAAEAMIGAINTRTQSRGSRQGATKGLTTSVRRARKAVRVLDSLVRFALKDDPALLASWDSVKRPPSKTGKAVRSAGPAAPAAPSAPPAPVASAPEVAAPPAASLSLVSAQG